MENLVSIIMPCFNASETIQKAIESVRRQNYENWELLITDDCSSDRTNEIVSKLMLEEPRIKLFKLGENQGVAAARNYSISHAKGSYIAFLDSDDCWLPTKLESQLSVMIKKGYVFSYTGYRKININDEIISKPINVSEKGVSYLDLLKHNEIGCLTVVVHASLLKDKVFRKVGHEDYVMWLTILKCGVKAFGINEVLSYYRVGNESISSNKVKSAKFTWNIYRRVEKLSFIQSLCYFSSYACHSFIKYLK